MATKKKTASKEVTISQSIMPARIIQPQDQDKYAGIKIPAFLKDHFDKEAPTGFTALISFGEDADNWLTGSWIVARLVNIRSDIGPNHSMMYDFDVTPDGKTFSTASLWGSTILDNKMRLLDPKPGQWVFIQYLGTTETSRKAQPAKDYRLAIVNEAFIKSSGYGSAI